ncbi:MAG: PEP-CTERM sorting domain-containing protein [Planctomycetota bacterium]
MLTALAIATTPVLVQATPSALVVEGDTVAGETASSLEAIRANEAGGYAFSFTDSSVGDEDFIAGTANGLSPLSILAGEGTVDGQTVISFLVNDFDFANNGSIAYRVGIDGSIEAVYRDASIVAIEGSAVPALSGPVYRTPNRPGITADGTSVHFVASFDQPAGSFAGTGLFTDDGTTKLLAFGDSLLGGVVDFVDLDYSVSANGTNWIDVFGDLAEPAASDLVVVLNGAVYTSGGSNVQENVVVPIASGGDGSDTWDNFDFFAVNEAGQTLITGDLDTGANDDDEFLAIDGVILFREGDTLGDGTELNGTIRAAVMNEAGDWAVVWGEGAGATDILLVNGEVVARIGDEVDLDGDLLPDPGITLTDIENGRGNLDIGVNTAGQFDVYFQGDTSSGDTAFFAVTVPEPGSLALLGVGGLALLRRRR